MWKLLVIGVCLLVGLGFADLARAEKQRAPRSVSIDSGYIPALANQHSMWNLWLEYEYLGTGIFDYVGDSEIVGRTFITRAIWGGLMGLGWNVVNYPLFVANHEFGHGARGLTLGLTPRYIWDGSSTEHASIFSFILEGFGHIGDGAVTVSSGAGTSFALPTNWGMTFTAGGMNNSMMWAEYLEDEVYYNTGHVNHLSSYLRAKLDAQKYATSTNNGFVGDLSTLISQWSALGYSISTRDVTTGSVVALLGSFTTWAYAWSGLRYIGVGDPNVTSLTLGALKLPDLSFFQGRSGLSYRLRSALNLGREQLPFSAEYVYKGSTTLEVSAGLRSSSFIGGGGGARKTGSSVQVYLSTAGGGGMRFWRDFAVGNASYFTLGTSLFTAQSLEGERTIGKLISSSLGVEGWAKFSMVY